MRRGNRRRLRRGRRSGRTGGRIGFRASGAGRRAGSWTAGAARAAVAFAVNACRQAPERAEAAGRGLADLVRGGRSGKRGASLGRRVSEVASSLHGRGLMIWAAALMTGLVCVWQHVHSSELALQIEALKGEREAVKTEIGLLEMECVELSGRKRVEEYATERLGMRYPRAGEVIWIGPSDSERPAIDQEDYVIGEASRETKG